ncbi:MAG: phosphopentomutase [Bacilli bacterium]|nr:phosphopentomutase [Bacilli bacterium]
MKFKRIFLIILDSLGVGEAIDSINYKDNGSNTLGHILEKVDLFIPNLKKIGFTDTLTMTEDKDVEAYYSIAKPTNAGKDSLNGHYEIVGLKNTEPYESFNEGFSYELITEIENITGRKVIGNKCSPNSEIIQELGDRQVNYGSLIVYTSADSDLQVAAHEDCIPISTLYAYCEKIREVTLRKGTKIARIIARPFTGVSTKYKLLHSARRDYAVKPPRKTILNSLVEKNYNVVGIGKINDIFDGEGINKTIKAKDNNEAINKLSDIIDKEFIGLCMVNLNDFDNCGHRRDIEGYAEAIEELDVDLKIILNKLELDDLLIITADHGNDPSFVGNGHTRENLPVIIYSRNFKTPRRLPPFETLGDIGATIADNFDIDSPELGKSFLDELE